MSDIQWDDEAIDLAWIAFWGGYTQVEKADMRAALNAGIKAQQKIDRDRMVQQIMEKNKEFKNK